MVNWIISSSILILAIILLRYMFKGKISLRLQYALWLLVAVRLLVPVNFGTSSLSVENLTEKAKGRPTVQSMMEVSEQTIPITSYESAYEEVIQRYEEEGRFAEGIGAEELEEMEYEAYALMEEISVGELVQKVAFIIWAVGAVVIGLVFLISNTVFGMRVKRTREQITFANAKLPVYVSDSVETPCLFGVFKPSIYVTKSVAENETLLRHSVLHETTHFLQGDSWWSLLRCVCLALHWYNPLVWKAATLSKQDAELACDEATIKKLGEGERKEYGETLIQLTCEKRQDLFVAATTMTSEKKSIKERIALIARKPRVKKYAIVFVMMAALTVVGCTFTNGTNSGDGKTDEVVDATETSEEMTSTGETENADDAGSETQKELLLYDESEKDELCLAIMPDGISKAGGDYRYIIPEDQIVWMDAYKEMKSYAVEASHIQEMGRSQGIWIVFNDEWTEVTEEGFIIGFQRTVERAEAERFWNLCVEEAMKYGSGTPMRPEELTSLASATLNYGGSYTVTDEEILTKLEKSLGASEELRGGGACPFTAELVLELERGDTQTIYLATDSCTVWLSDGVYYTYSGFADIEDLKAVMQEAAETEEREKLGKSQYLSKIDWEGMKTRLTGEEYASIQRYLPALEGGEITWIYRSGDGEEPDTYLHAKKQISIQGIIEEWFEANNAAPKEALVNSILFADVFQTGELDTCLLLEYFGWNWIILHEENGIIYCIDMPVRWFQDVQEDGLYSGSGGVGYNYYHRMKFVDGDYLEEDIGDIINDVLYIDDIAQSEATYQSWRKENIRDTVERYTPVD